MSFAKAFSCVSLIICSSLMISSIGVNSPVSLFSRVLLRFRINRLTQLRTRTIDSPIFVLPWLIYSIPFGVSCWFESPHQVHLVSHKSSGLDSSYCHSSIRRFVPAVNCSCVRLLGCTCKCMQS